MGMNAPTALSARLLSDRRATPDRRGMTVAPPFRGADRRNGNDRRKNR